MPTNYEIPQLAADFGDPAHEVVSCRTSCALFDFSFVHRASVKGHDARQIVERFASRSLAHIPEGKISYALRLGEDGNLVSDLTIWKVGSGHFEVMSGHPQDIEDLKSHGGPTVDDLTAGSAIFAVQGPRAYERLAPCCKAPEQLLGLGYFEHSVCAIEGTECRVGRLGYTGEAGFEVICSRADAPQLWSKLAGRMEPAGFIAADTLRIEAGFPLFWNDFALPVTAAEAGLSAFTNSHAPTPALKRICFSADCAAQPGMWRPKKVPQRPGQTGEVAVTSACHSARAERALGLGYILAQSEETPGKLFDQAGTFTNMRLEPLPFYDFAKLRPRAAWR